MDTVKRAVSNLNRRMTDKSRRPPMPFEEFLRETVEQPETVLRNVFQVLHDMIHWYIGTGVDEYPEDPESIHYMHFDCSRLFELDTDRPFFADRIFANRLVSAVESIKRGTQQNKIYIFRGPPGCGKSTFLNNLLRKFESYANTAEGMRYEMVWRLSPNMFGRNAMQSSSPAIEKLASILGQDLEKHLDAVNDHHVAVAKDGKIEIPCPSHDHPILIIPKDYRRSLFRDLFGSSPFLERLFNDREYNWVFRDKPCTFCSSLYRSLLNTVKKPDEVHRMIYARPFRLNRRLGEGVTVFNPGDPPPKSIVVHNPGIQSTLDNLLQDASEVRYLYSRYAHTNNGVYALMDVKSHNVERLIELHNIISEGVHKVEDIEENVNTLLLAIMNPEDEKNVKEFRSFSDRIEYITVPYVMDRDTEGKIYQHTFGANIRDRFLPRVVENFARVIISSRMNARSEAMLEWIGDPKKYSLYCDENLQLLKMEIYAGIIPSWLDEGDRKKLTAKRRRSIIAESEREGAAGISGRDSINIFNEFIMYYGKQDKMINMSMLVDFFTRGKKDLLRSIPAGFIESVVRMYNYTVLQEVKEALYYYNEKQISRDIQNYLYAVNFETGTEISSPYTKDKLLVSEEFFEGIEMRLLGAKTATSDRQKFREYVQREYTTRAITQEMVGDRRLTDTNIYSQLHDRYLQNIKEKALDPFLENENFRRAIKEYGAKDFKAHDKRIQEDVRYLLRNLEEKFGYTEKGAQEVCMYVIDNDLAKTFAVS